MGEDRVEVNSKLMPTMALSVRLSVTKTYWRHWL